MFLKLGYSTRTVPVTYHSVYKYLSYYGHYPFFCIIVFDNFYTLRDSNVDYKVFLIKLSFI